MSQNEPGPNHEINPLVRNKVDLDRFYEPTLDLNPAAALVLLLLLVLLCIGAIALVGWVAGGAG